MKRLILLRHAKSSWDDPEMDDRDRPLNARGRRDAPRMAAHLAEKGYRPDIALCSPAERTRETLQAALERLGEFPVIYPDTLYLGDPTALKTAIADVDSGYQTLLLVGHNPGIGKLASQLTDFESLEEAFVVSKFPTAALAVFETNAPNWPTAMTHRLKLTDFATPKTLEMQ